MTTWKCGKVAPVNGDLEHLNKSGSNRWANFGEITEVAVPPSPYGGDNGDASGSGGIFNFGNTPTCSSSGSGSGGLGSIFNFGSSPSCSSSGTWVKPDNIDLGRLETSTGKLFDTPTHEDIFNANNAFAEKSTSGILSSWGNYFKAHPLDFSSWLSRADTQDENGNTIVASVTPAKKTGTTTKKTAAGVSNAAGLLSGALSAITGKKAVSGAAAGAFGAVDGASGSQAQGTKFNWVVVAGIGVLAITVVLVGAAVIKGSKAPAPVAPAMA